MRSWAVWDGAMGQDELRLDGVLRSSSIGRAAAPYNG
jgi:hypothetical protein